MPTARIALLGGFAVRGDDPPPPVRGLIPQAIVARLVIAQGEAVPADALVADLWPTPPDGVLSSLRAHVSRLRSRGWGDLLSGGRDGYRLEPADVDADVWQLERLVLGSPGDRVADLETAARLWRPDPLGWAKEFPFAAPTTARLAAWHRQGALELAAARIAAGDPAAAAEGLRDLAAADPADGETQTLLAQALTRSGRPADALAVLDRHLELLGDDTAGSRESTALRQAIARQDPAVFGLAADSSERVERVGVPVPLTRFVGRAEALAAVRRGRRESRLVTLTGTAGVGKTRLAVEAARRAEFADDEVQWFVDLTGAAAPDDVLTLVAGTVGAAEPSMTAIERLVGGRRGLLVLDNAEHVLGAVATVCAGLLGACSGLSILVTSREALRMAGERIIAVHPLIGEQAGEAVELFLERAADAGGARDPDELDAVARLCATLDGLPLAIELAASRLDVLSLDEVASSLGSDPDSPAHGGRHASLDTAIEWSVRLLRPAERELLAQLAGFAGPFTLDTVAGVCVVPGHDVRPLAVALVRKSLVHTVSGGRGRRFRLLEAVRQYVRRNVPAADAEWSRRHAAWFRDAAVGAYGRLPSPTGRAARAEMADMQRDLNQAVLFSIREGDRATAVALVAAVARVWSDRGLGAETQALIDQALALPGPATPDDEATALFTALYIAVVGSDFPSALAYHARMMVVAPHARDPRHGMFAHSLGAYFAKTGATPDDVDGMLEAAEEYRRAIPEESTWAVSEYLCIRGEVLRASGRPAQALDALGEAFRLAGDVGYGWARGSACLITGRVLLEVGRPDEAVGILRTSVLRFLENEDPASAISAMEVHATALTRLDRAETAAELFGAVDALGHRHGYRRAGVDPAIVDRARRSAEAALPPGRYAELVEQGRTRSFRWVAEHLAT